MCIRDRDKDKINISNHDFCKALSAEGIPCGAGYVKPLYLNPIYHEKKVFAFRHYDGNARYEKGMCPVTEILHDETVVILPECRSPATKDDMIDIIKAIQKIIENKGEFEHTSN